MENWTNLYKELTEILQDKMPEILWIDLWHNQVNFLQDEHPFRTPAVFLSFRTLGTQDLGMLQQEINLQVDFYLFYETFADTYNGAFNQESALEFLHSMDELHTTFHGLSGKNFSAMRRIGFAPEDTGGAGNLYRISFSCIIQDTGAMKEMEERVVTAQLVNDMGDNEFVLIP